MFLTQEQQAPSVSQGSTRSVLIPTWDKLPVQICFVFNLNTVHWRIYTIILGFGDVCLCFCILYNVIWKFILSASLVNLFSKSQSDR